MGGKLPLGHQIIPTHAEIRSAEKAKLKSTRKPNTNQFKIIVKRKNFGVRSREMLLGMAKITPFRSYKRFSFQLTPTIPAKKQIARNPAQSMLVN